MKKAKRKIMAFFRNDFTAFPSKSLFVHLFITKRKFEVNAIRKNIPKYIYLYVGAGRVGLWRDELARS
jgi:hypothetical protein